MKDKEYISEDGVFKLRVTQSCLDQIKDFCKASPGKETGGIMFGQYLDNHSIASILVISGPPKDSKRTQFSFVRGKAGVQKLVDDNWAEGGYYLGEWHYHPNASPEPSSQDIKQLHKIARDRRFNCPEPIMLIIGGKPGNFSINILLSNSGGELIKYYEHEFNNPG
ncbi:MAG: Mov34/MPN/PAD-1 family protein [Taibaiella sp.]|nr:Mov34/MPN/PAD-1 family protein [Taibaiella sp.]